MLITSHHRILLLAVLLGTALTGAAAAADRVKTDNGVLEGVTSEAVFVHFAAFRSRRRRSAICGGSLHSR